MRIALAIAAAAAILGAPASASTGFDLVSWADFDHAWASLQGTVYATSDAGKTWRPVFSGTQIFRVERTSATAGIVVTGEPKPVTFWTRDAGRHWFRGTEAFATAVGHGGQLYGASGATLQQLKPWPPRAYRCKGPWWSSAVGPGANPKAAKNICSIPVSVPVQKTSVLTLSRGELAPDTLEPVPGGIAGVATDASARGRPLSVVVYRLGRGVEVPLPNAFPQETGFSALQLYVSWPNLLLRADAGAVHVVWGSDDGGDTWNTLTR